MLTFHIICSEVITKSFIDTWAMFRSKDCAGEYWVPAIRVLKSNILCTTFIASTSAKVSPMEISWLDCILTLRPWYVSWIRPTLEIVSFTQSSFLSYLDTLMLKRIITVQLIEKRILTVPDLGLLKSMIRDLYAYNASNLPLVYLRFA